MRLIFRHLYLVFSRTRCGFFKTISMNFLEYHFSHECSNSPSMLPTSQMLPTSKIERFRSINECPAPTELFMLGSDEDPSLGIEIFSIINLRGVSTKLI